LDFKVLGKEGRAEGVGLAILANPQVVASPWQEAPGNKRDFRGRLSRNVHVWEGGGGGGARESGEVIPRHVGRRARKESLRAHFSMEVMSDKGERREARVPRGAVVGPVSSILLSQSLSLNKRAREALCYMGINNRTAAIIRNNISVGILVLAALPWSSARPQRS
jgi:hypothetical protein